MIFGLSHDLRERRFSEAPPGFVGEGGGCSGETEPRGALSSYDRKLPQTLRPAPGVTWKLRSLGSPRLGPTPQILTLNSGLKSSAKRIDTIRK